jgi:hypothetical protein
MVLFEDEANPYVVKDGDRYTVVCTTSVEGTLNAVDYHYQDQTHTEWKEDWYMGGNQKKKNGEDSQRPKQVSYLTTDCGTDKTFEVVGRVWRGECFRATFVLESVCG